MKKTNKPNFAILLIVFSITLYFIVKLLVNSSMNYSSGKLPVIVYFTVQSNIFVLIWYFYLLLKTHFKKLPDVGAGLALALTMYITITGVVYWFVLVPMYNFDEFLFTPSNIWLHTVTPLFSVWCFFTMTQKDHINENQIVLALIYPLLYLASSFLDKTYLGSFPYPFLDNNAMGGILPVIIACFAILILFLFIGGFYGKLYNKSLKNN